MLQDQKFCWCNKGYIRDSSYNCVKFEDCLNHEERKLETFTSSEYNEYSKQLEAVRKPASYSPDLLNSLDTYSRIQEFSRTIAQNVLDLVCGKPGDLFAGNNNRERVSIPNPSKPLDQDLPMSTPEKSLEEASIDVKVSS